MYHVEFSENAIKQLKKLDKQIGSMIFAWITKHLEGCDNPRNLGKGLVQDKIGIWRYRIGDYRLLVHIFEGRLVVLVVDVAHRREIYK